MLYLPSFNIITIQYNNIAFLFLNRRKITQSNTMHEYVRNLVTKKKGACCSSGTYSLPVDVGARPCTCTTSCCAV